MCGLAGFSGSFTEDSLRDAGGLLAHRGPDDSGVYLNERGVGLAFRRLAIIDLSPRGAQPMASPDGQVVIVFNGEIYNFRELRDELRRRGVEFRGESDTEVLLQLYLAEGEGMLSRLNGIFAFALWDGRNGTLFVARDALGVKPLYYAAIDRGVAFASEIKALLPMVPEVRELDPVALQRYLTFLWCPGAGTPLRSVRKLLPGEALLVREGRVERRWSWYQPPLFRPTGAARPNEGEAVSGTVDHLRRAVQRQLVADVPVGAFLSGGLDSSAIVTFAREQVPDIRCFTIESTGEQDSGFTDDLPYARRVAAHLHVPLEVVTVDALGMADDLEQMIWQLDEPLADPAPLNVLYISRLARRHGVKVLLSGAGGDDLFSGYRRHLAARYERYWSWLPQSVRAGLDRATGGLDQRHVAARRLGKLFNGAGLGADARLVNYFHWIREPELQALFTPECRMAANAEGVDAPMLATLAALPPGTGPLDRMLALEQGFFLPDHNLTYTDKMSMAAGVEVRVPFLDLELVDFAARIPERMKQRGTVGKWVLKKGMEPFLPSEIIYRPKTGFGAPLRRWMRGGLRPLMADILSPDSLRKRGLFDPSAVQRLIQRNESGEVDAAYTILSLMSIEIWCRKFLDAPSDPEGLVTEARPVLIDIIAGARPNFIKIAPILAALRAAAARGVPWRCRLVHTGQHYDRAMSGEFFAQLGIPDPDVNLEVGSGTQAEQTANIMVRYEQLLTQSPSDLCIVVGDVTSTMACTIVARKLGIEVAHVEGGIRSGDWTMPEEINRVVTDAIANWFFTTSVTAGDHLRHAGVTEERIHFVGNTMIDTLLTHLEALRPPTFWSALGLVPRGYLVLTLHRPANVDGEGQLRRMLQAIMAGAAGVPVIFPVHPRTLKTLQGGAGALPGLHAVEPQGYLEFNYLVRHALGVVTDSGGVTEEATVLGVPCLTLRDSTERPETVTVGTNELVGTDPEKLAPYLARLRSGGWKKGSIPERWDGKAAERIVEFLERKWLPGRAARPHGA